MIVKLKKCRFVLFRLFCHRGSVTFLRSAADFSAIAYLLPIDRDLWLTLRDCAKRLVRGPAWVGIQMITDKQIGAENEVQAENDLSRRSFGIIKLQMHSFSGFIEETWV